MWLPEARDLGLHQLYRALDVLAEHGDAIEQAVFWRAVDLFKLDVDLVSYDGTTAWFETDEEDVASHEWRGPTFEPLRQRGHSKEGRDNDPQVVIAPAVTRDGVPVRSWIVPGATPDVTTVRTIKDDLRAMRLGRALFVGDAGLYARANLDELAKGAGRDILATPIRRVKEIRDEVLSHPGRYADIAPHLRAREVLLGEGERRRRYILCLNEEEAERRLRHRAALLASLEAELDRLKADHPGAACRLLASKRFGPYLGRDDHGRPYLDKDRIRRAEQLDGKFVLTTNDDTLSVADIALGYKGMWIIESCSRRMKTTGLAVRPMYHWMPHRITAHVKLCVLALMIQRAAEIAAGLPWRQLEGDRQTPGDLGGDRLAGPDRVAGVPAQQRAEPGQVLDVERLVDPEVGPELGELLRAERRRRAEPDGDRVARDQPQEQEGQHRDPEQGRRHAQQPLDEVRGHRCRC